MNVVRLMESTSRKPVFGFLFFLFCKFFFKFYCPLSIKGRENLPDAPFIICSNHSSHMDTPVLMLATTFAFNRLGTIAAKDYFFDHKKRRHIVNLFMNILPISRQCTRASLGKDLEQCRVFIQRTNGCLIIYPEGTRSLDGNIQPFKRGIALIAGELGLPIVPVYIQGTHRALGKWTIFPRPGKINIIIGESLQLAETTQRRHYYRHMMGTLENKVRELKEYIL
jgi:1-acyl-sn-glycerol-3-phosphate acyltransferase/long-chain acyl-CoA synthetase